MGRLECAAANVVFSIDDLDQICDEKISSQKTNQLQNQRLEHVSCRNIKMMFDSKRYGMTKADIPSTQECFIFVTTKKTKFSWVGILTFK